MFETDVKEKDVIADNLSDEEISFHLRQVLSDLEGSLEDYAVMQKHLSHLIEMAERNNWGNVAYYLTMAQGSLDD